MTGQFKRVAALLEPLDVLFFRDGRPFRAAMRGYSGLPVPQTTAGAVWAALLQPLGCDFDRIREVFRRGTDKGESPQGEYHVVWRSALLRAGTPEWFFDISIRGPWLTRARNGEKAQKGKSDPADWELIFPMPATVYSFKKGKEDRPELWLGKPLSKGQKLPGWKPPREGMRPIWVATREDVEPWNGFITAAGMQKFLQGEKPNQADLVKEDELFGYDDRTGIAMNPDRLTSEESYIYAANFLALRNNVGFYVEVTLPAKEEAIWKSVSFLRWGGEGKHVAVRHLDAPVAFPHAVPQNGQKPLLVLTTPGLFEAGWYPQCLREYLVAAAVPGETAVSGWDLARRGPKPTRFGAAAGSVYFLEQLPQGLADSLSDSPVDRQQGWGCFLQGVWNDD